MWEAARADPGIIYFKTRYSSRNNVYLIYKNMPLLQIILNLPFLAAGFLIKFLFFAVKGNGQRISGRYKEWIFHQPQGSKSPVFDETSAKLCQDSAGIMEEYFCQIYCVKADLQIAELNFIK